MRRFAGDQQGQAILIVATTMTAMLMAVGLAVDAGQLYVARRTAQEAADAGAYAGAVVLYQGGTTTQARTAAVTDVTRNGYTHGGDGGLTSVVVNLPPASGPKAGNSAYVEVVISTQVRTALVPAQSTLNLVSVRGVAGAEPLNNGYAIMALDRGNAANALRVENNGSVSVDGAGILVNSTSSTAAYNQDSDGSNISIAEPYGLDVTGGTSGGWPNPSTGAPQRPDPFAGYPKPSTAGMTVYTFLPGAAGGSPPTITLYPGVYTVPINAAGGTRVILTTGIYVVKAGMNGSGNMDLVSGAGGVFIFNTTSDYPTGSSGTCGSIGLMGNANSSLAPMTTGTYAGLLVYQDPACTAEFRIAGNGALTASGTIYLPNAPFVMNGNNATLTGSQLVAKTVDIQNGNISISFDSGMTAQPILPRLAE